MRCLESAAVLLMLLSPATAIAQVPGGAASQGAGTTQEGSDVAAVRAALEHYLAGHATGRGAHFDSVFHQSSNLYWIVDGELQTRTGAAYIAGASGSPAANESERKRRIVWIEVTGTAAVARIDLDYPGIWFTDYMSLLEVDGEWRIVNKIFHIDRTGEPQSSGGPTDGVREIAAASRAFSSAYVAGDTAAIRDLYTEDAVLLPPDREVRGRDAIARYFAPGPRRRNVAHSMRSEDLRISGETAIDAGTWTHRWQSGEEPVGEASGRYMVIWRRGDDGRWRMEYDMWHRPVD